MLFQRAAKVDDRDESPRDLTAKVLVLHRSNPLLSIAAEPFLHHQLPFAHSILDELLKLFRRVRGLGEDFRPL
jgi:hypothetical protein